MGMLSLEHLLIVVVNA